MTELADRADRAWQLADEGLAVVQIARELGVSRESVYTWLARDEVPLSRAWLFRDAASDRPACSFCLGEGPGVTHDRACAARGRAPRLSLPLRGENASSPGGM